jgi:hypothetical protein
MFDKMRPHIQHQPAPARLQSLPVIPEVILQTSDPDQKHFSQDPGVNDLLHLDEVPKEAPIVADKQFSGSSARSLLNGFGFNI